MIQTLVSLPPAAARLGGSSLATAAYVDSDPPGRQLGSGGGTAHLLYRAWKNLSPGATFSDWLGISRKLIIHASGQSRRLPAYAAEGKARIPVPMMESAGQTYTQTLVDLQADAFIHILRHAPATYRLCVTCGDTLLRCPHAMPIFPEADVLIIGVPSSPEEAAELNRLTDEIRAMHLMLYRKHSPGDRESISEQEEAIRYGIDLLPHFDAVKAMRLAWQADQDELALFRKHADKPGKFVRLGEWYFPGPFMQARGIWNRRGAWECARELLNTRLPEMEEAMKGKWRRR